MHGKTPNLKSLRQKKLIVAKKLIKKAKNNYSLPIQHDFKPGERILVWETNCSAKQLFSYMDGKTPNLKSLR